MKNILLFLSLFAASFVQAQETGSFDITVDFDESDYDFTRTLYYHVPTDYDASQSYKLVVGFRGGPHSNAGQFRDQLTFLSDSIGAIILCPENSEHFWNEEGLTKQLFQYSLDAAMANYNIDSNFIYLTGLSYGGRHAVIVSMDTENGPIPNLRGVIPFAAGSESDLQAEYDAIADFPPACICIGLNDSGNFQNVSNNLHNDIQSNNGVSMLNEIPGVGHTVQFADYPNEMMECFGFIEAQYETTATIDLSKEINLSIYPNPVKHLLNISFDESITADKISITDIDGKLLIEVNPLQKQIDVSALNTGVKILSLHIGKQTISQQFTIVK